MLREITAGLCLLLSVGCSGGDAEGPRRIRVLTNEADAGPMSAPDAGAVAPCDWIEYWRTDIDQDTPCHWSMRSRDTSLALFRSDNGTCLAPATICDMPACSDLVEVRERSIVEIWGPPGIDPETVWSAAEFFNCE